MPNKHNIKIIKVKSEQKNIDRPQIFPRMPRLYLELLENKAKIKQDLINQEYRPTNSSYENNPNLKFVDKNNNLESRLDKILDEDEDEDDNSSVQKNDSKSEGNIDDFDKYEDENKDDKDYKEDDKNSYSKYDTDTDSDKSSVKSTKTTRTIRDDNSSVDDLQNRLNELLDDSEPSSVATKYSNKKDKYNKPRNLNVRSASIAYKQPLPPSLAELEAKGGYVRKAELRDVNHVTMSEQEEEDAKRELMFKFELLKKSYPHSTIPEFSIHSDYNSMKKSYDSSVRRLSLDSSVESYKTYLIGGFMACEFVLGYFLKFDMQGFTQQQILSMNSYEKLLIELGEKSYVPTGSKWPVEIRLLFMIIMNAAFFIISRMILKKTGANLLGMINNMNVSNHQPATQQAKRKMKGPEIDLDNLPEN